MTEKIIEDILSSDKTILAELLSISPANMNLIARQKILNSGKLDLLCLSEDVLVLIELKTVPFTFDIVDEINGYHQDLIELQKNHRLIDAPIKKIILVTDYNHKDKEFCDSQNVQLVSFKPEHVLSKYYENFKEMTSFLTIRSGDFGVVRLALLIPTLQLISKGKKTRDISAAEGKSEKTIRNRLSVATLIGLVTKFKGEYFLTDSGIDFIEARDSSNDRLSEKQVELLSDFLKQNPFYSSITYTILSLLESAFVLAKSSYPVPEIALRDYFVKSVGKESTWRSPKARQTATYIFSNYACELDLLAKVGNHFYVTPKGIQAILLLQLNRSIKLIESRT